MTTKKKEPPGEAKPGKLRVKKETVKDLEPKGKGTRVRGGLKPGPGGTNLTLMACTAGCTLP